MTKVSIQIAGILFLVLTFFSNATFAANERDKQIAVLKELLELTDLHDTIRANTMIQLSQILRANEPEAALNYGRRALDLAQNLKMEIFKANALNSMGTTYWRLGELGLAMDYMLEARHIFTEQNNEMGIARILTNIGLIYSDRSQYEKALEYFFEALRIFEEKGQQLNASIVLNNIGKVYELRGDYDLSEKYHILSLELKEDVNDGSAISSYSYHNLGIIYQYQGKYDEAVKSFQKALNIREKIGDKRGMASTISHMGHMYFELGDFNKALNHLYDALRLHNEVNDQSGVSLNLNYLGQVYLEMDDLPKAEEYFNNSLSKAKNIGLTRVIIKNYNGLAKMNAKRKNFYRAYSFQQEALDIEDSLFTEESRRRMYELQRIFDSETKEREIELYRKASQINALNYEKQRLLKNFLLAGIVLVVLLLFLLYNRFLVINKSNKLLEKRRDEISKSNAKLVKLNKILFEQKKKLDDLNKKLNNTNQKLTDSEKHLIEASTAKDKLFSIISHDLRNPFASIVSFSRMLKRDIDNLTKEELKELSGELDKTVINITDLLENLLQWTRTQIGKIKYNPHYVDLTEIVNENVNLFKPNAEEKQIFIENGINSNLIVWADQNMTDTVMRNLLSNAIKFANKKGQIQLSYKTDKDYVYVSVNDNGIGISKQDQEMLFRADSLHSTFGTNDEKGSGIGLLLCKEFVEKQYGKISFESEEGVGSTFTFSLPLSEVI